MKDGNLCIAQRLGKDVAVPCSARTAVLVAVGQEVRGVVSIADGIRDEAKNLVPRLKAAGVHRVVMLTGDNRRVARAVARELGMDSFEAEILPEGKVEVIRRLKQEGLVVAMVGDGINDAPAASYLNKDLFGFCVDNFRKSFVKIREFIPSKILRLHILQWFNKKHIWHKSC
ncbi:HAD-IC family P-type ATPase [Desulfofundulus sp.]|uniref:HAD-IC family P-type ATPase n=1 Tax=Desulfofundulus sp. TaxID=2282750 RepID=UPI003C794CC5